MKYTDEQIMAQLTKTPDASNRQIILALGAVPNKSITSRIKTLREKLALLSVKSP